MFYAIFFLKWKENLSNLVPKCFYWNSEQIDTKISNIGCSIVNLWSFKRSKLDENCKFCKTPCNFNFDLVEALKISTNKIQLAK